MKVSLPGLTIRKDAITAISGVNVNKDDTRQTWFYSVYFDGNAVSLHFASEKEAVESRQLTFDDWIEE